MKLMLNLSSETARTLDELAKKRGLTVPELFTRGLAALEAAFARSLNASLGASDGEDQVRKLVV